MTITIDALASNLNDHSRMFAQDIQTASRLGLELENILPQRLSDGEYYVVENASATEVLQPYQGTFTPKGSVTHSENKIRVRPLKMDLQFTEVELAKWYNSWMISRMEAGKDPMAWTFPRYIVEKEIIPKFNDDLNNAAWNGVYVAPAPGVAGAAVDSVDGYQQEITTAIAAGTISTVVTAVISTSNIREEVEAFLDAIPEHITAKGGRVLMPPKHVRWYNRDYRSEFSALNTPYGVGGVPKTMVDSYNIELSPIATMSGSTRWIFLPNGRDGMVWVGRTGYPVYPNMIFNANARVLEMYATIYRGYGFEYPQEVYVNVPT